MLQKRLATALAAFALVAGACRDALEPTAPAPAELPAAVTLAATPLEASGQGAIGTGMALPGMNRQEFDFFVTSPPAGRFFIRDYSVLRTSTSVVASMTVDPADPATAITAFEQVSATCVTFGGIGRVDTGDRFAFTVEACDHGSPGTGVDFFSIAVPEINYTKRGSLIAGDVAVTGATLGDLDVAATTSGNDIDPDGYVVTLDGATSQPIGTDGTVTFPALPPGTHVVEISGLAANCAADATSHTVSVTAGSVTHAAFAVTCTATTATRTFATGRGVIGSGAALPGQNRFELDFDVTSDLTGRVLLTDYAVTRSDGSPGTMTVDSTDPETFISSFTRTSEACVSFGGVGRLNDRDLLYAFFIDACDTASPGAGSDTFTVELPDRPYSKSGTLSEGDIVVGTTTS